MRVVLVQASRALRTFCIYPVPCKDLGEVIVYFGYIWSFTFLSSCFVRFPCLWRIVSSLFFQILRLLSRRLLSSQTRTSKSIGIIPTATSSAGFYNRSVLTYTRGSPPLNSGICLKSKRHLKIARSRIHTVVHMKQATILRRFGLDFLPDHPDVQCCIGHQIEATLCYSNSHPSRDLFKSSLDIDNIPRYVPFVMFFLRPSAVSQIMSRGQFRTIRNIYKSMLKLFPGVLGITPHLA